MKVLFLKDYQKNSKGRSALPSRIFLSGRKEIPFPIRYVCNERDLYIPEMSPSPTMLYETKQTQPSSPHT